MLARDELRQTIGRPPFSTRNPLRSLIEQLTAQEYPTADHTGKTVIVTGGSSGLGLEAARHFVRLNAKTVILGCRDVAKGAAAKQDIEASAGREGVVQVWEVDLCSFDSVRSFCQRAAGQLENLDVVVENAGVYDKEYHVAEGYERQITVNVLSTFLMAVMLLPLLKRSATTTTTEAASAAAAPSHLVIVASNAHLYPSFPERHADSVFEALRGSENMGLRYATSKLLVVLAARELSRQVESGDGEKVVVNFLDTGLCRTSLFRGETFPMSWILGSVMWLIGRTSEMGSRILLWAASAGPETHGRYVEDCRVGFESAFVRSEEGRLAQEKVWRELVEILEGIEPGVTKQL